jgi:uncharacterized membrane protein
MTSRRWWTNTGVLRRARGVAASLGGLVIAVSASTALAQPRLYRIELGGSPVSAQVRAVSADGTTVVGSYNAGAGARAFRWTEASGLIDLGNHPLGGATEATGVSGDGSVIVGSGSVGQPFIWTASTGMQDFPTVPGATQRARPTGVSADGQYVVGSNYFLPPIRGAAFRWSAGGGFEPVAGPSNSTWQYTTLRSVLTNADGSVVVGEDFSGAVSKGFIWTPDGAYRTLYVGQDTSITGVSADGSTIVGWSNRHVGFFDDEALAWSRDGIRIGSFPRLGPTIMTRALCVNGDGTLIGGTSDSLPVVWNQRRAVDLPGRLSALGSVGAGFSTSAGVRAISADGRTIAGTSSATGWSFVAFDLDLSPCQSSLITGFTAQPGCAANTLVLTANVTGPATNLRWEYQRSFEQWEPVNTWSNIPNSNGFLFSGTDPTQAQITLTARPNNSTPSNGRVRVRLVSSTTCNTSIGAVYDWRICAPDFDCSGVIEPPDVFAFLRAYFARAPRGDVNGDGQFTAADIARFLDLYFFPTVCSNF